MILQWRPQGVTSHQNNGDRFISRQSIPSHILRMSGPLSPALASRATCEQGRRSNPKFEIAVIWWPGAHHPDCCRLPGWDCQRAGRNWGKLGRFHGHGAAFPDQRKDRDAYYGDSDDEGKNPRIFSSMSCV